MNALRLGLVCAALAALPQSKPAHSETSAEKAASTSVADNDVVFATRGEVELKLDLARPAKGDGPFPAVIVLTGGAWKSARKPSTRETLSVLASRGYVAVSPDYRLAPSSRFPAQVHDVKEVVRWLRAKHVAYRVDPERIGMIGYSSGAHLAMMVGFTSPADGLEGVERADALSSRVQAVVNFFGPVDLTATDLPEDVNRMVSDFLGASAAEDMQTARRASPILYLSKDDPPVLTFHGTNDPVVSQSHALQLASVMAERGVPGRVVLEIGGGHGDWDLAEQRRTFDEAVQFLDRTLKR